MEVVYWLIPIVLFVGFLVVLVFIWMAKSGQFDDLDGAANSIFMEDDEFDLKQKSSNSAEEAANTEQKQDSKSNHV